jgi:hypothetical protein
MAGTLVRALADADPDILRFSGVDLQPALEQRLFITLRDGRALHAGRLARAATRAAAVARPLAAAGVGAARAWRVPPPGEGPLVVLVREAAHYPVLAQIEGELQEMGGESLTMVRVGRAAHAVPAHAIAPRLADLLMPRRALQLLAFEASVRRALARSTTGWGELVGTARASELRTIALGELGRIALGTAGLLSMADRWQPALLAAFDEIGTWARLLPAVARSRGIPSLDLPHAEAADVHAIRGVSYDRMAVYGPHAADVLAAADYPRESIVQIGAPRFDPLVRATAADPAPAATRRVVFAAQYVAGAMRPAVLAACYRAALAAAGAAGAAQLVLVPHPAEAPGTASRLVERHPAPDGVHVRLAPAGSLHEALRGTWLVVTGWSNSVFEAAVAGVPALTINPDGVAPVDFAADGLSLGATDEATAAAAARSLLDEAMRVATIDRARQVATERLGSLDGRASARAARLMLAMARGGGG